MGARKLGIAILVLIGLITASFVVAEMKDRLNVGNANAAPLGGNTLYVGGSGPNNYTKIQDAITDALNGDIIYVYEGIYNENIKVDKTIQLIGENKNTTVIDGSNSGDVIHVSAGYTLINGFTIRNSGRREGDAGIEVISNNVTISNNLIAGNGRDGVYLNFSSNNIISRNSIFSNRYNGIFLYSGFNNIITENTITNQSYDPYYSRGIHLQFSSNNIISDNILSDNVGYDIFLVRTSNIRVENNNCVDASGVFIVGINLSEWNTHIIENNYVGGKPLYYYKDVITPTEVPLDAGEIILANCSNFVIQHLNISTGDIGILLGFSSYNNISYNNITNTIAGIWITHSSHNTLYNNHISNVGGGIPITSLSSHNNILANTIEDNWEYGIGIWSSSYNAISNNIINNNQQAGIYIIDYSIMNKISHDTIIDNFYGIYISSSFINFIRNNNFIKNHEHAFFQDSLANLWLRNYWDDHIKWGPEVINGKIALPWNPSIILDWKNFDWHPAQEPYGL